MFLISTEGNGSQTMNDKVIYSNHSKNKSNDYSSITPSSDGDTNNTYSNIPNATEDVYYCAPSKIGSKRNIDLNIYIFNQSFIMLILNKILGCLGE